ncbi:MAG: hypothetical protein CM15mP122_5410 [Bacteroidota bacterium]|nr:MAG: hypothetical protein CM15mP122_5410 [Bacteroidota bacterium]
MALCKVFWCKFITFTSGALGNIADGDVVTIDMIDGNGCVTSSATQSRTVSVSVLPTAGLSSSAPDGLFVVEMLSVLRR